MERGFRQKYRLTKWGVSYLVGAIVIVILAALLALVAAEVAAGNYELHPVRTGAMRPSFTVGGIAIAERTVPARVVARDVIVFQQPGDPGRLVARRVISITNTKAGIIVRTQGDNRPSPDPWTLNLGGRPVYVVTATVPVLGYLVSWDQAGNGATSVLIVSGFVVLLVFGGLLFEDWRTSDDRHDAAPLPEDSATGTIAPDTNRVSDGRTTASSPIGE